LKGSQSAFLKHFTIAEQRRLRITVTKSLLFALLGLAFDGEQFVRSPSYDWTNEETCFELTKSVIWAKKSLDIIFAAAPSMKLQNLQSSWIPDYLHFGHSGESHILAGLSRYISGEDERYRTGHLGRRWNAT
jgi:hypothetical protein